MTPLRPKLKKNIFFCNLETLKFSTQKKMMPKSQAKIKPSFLQYPFLTIFNPKKYHVNKYTILSFNRIIKLYSNVYDYVIYTLNYY